MSVYLFFKSFNSVKKVFSKDFDIFDDIIGCALQFHPDKIHFLIAVALLLQIFLHVYLPASFRVSNIPNRIWIVATYIHVPPPHHTHTTRH